MYCYISLQLQRAVLAHQMPLTLINHRTRFYFAKKKMGVSQMVTKSFRIFPFVLHCSSIVLIPTLTACLSILKLYLAYSEEEQLAYAIVSGTPLTPRAPKNR